MKFSVLHESINKALSYVSAASTIKSTNNILNNVLIQAKGISVTFTCFDLSLSISYTFDANIIQDGEITVPVRLLNNFIAKLNKTEELIFDVNEQILTVTTSKGYVNLPTLPVDHFPTLLIVDGDNISVDLIKFKKGIEQVLFTTSKDEISKAMLCGVNIKIKDNKLVCESTDGNRVSQYKVEINCDYSKDHEISAIIPTLPLRSLLKIIESYEGIEKDLKISLSNNLVKFTVDCKEFSVVSRIKDTKYPDVDMLVGDKVNNSKTNIILNRLELIDILESINAVAPENYLITFTFLLKKNKLNVNATNIVTDGEFSIDIINILGDVQYEEHKIEIGLNSKYFIEALKYFYNENIVIKYNGNRLPLMITDEVESWPDYDYFYMMMPMVVKN